MGFVGVLPFAGGFGGFLGLMILLFELRVGCLLLRVVASIVGFGL